MTNVYEGIGFSLLSLSDLEDPRRAGRVIEHLLAGPPDLVPRKFAAFEPADRLINAGDITPVVDLWLNADANSRNRDAGEKEGHLILESAGAANYQVGWRKSSSPSFSLAGGDVPFSLLRRTPRGLEDFLAQIKGLVPIIEPVYGEVRNMAFPGWDLPFDLQKRLPDIPWVSIYGSPYVSFFGRSKLLNAPFERIEDLGHGHLWLQASKSASEPVPEDVKARIRAYLGEEAFMSGKRWRYADGRAPRFEFDHVVLR